MHYIQVELGHLFTADYLSIFFPITVLDVYNDLNLGMYH